MRADFEWSQEEKEALVKRFLRSVESQLEYLQYLEKTGVLRKIDEEGKVLDLEWKGPVLIVGDLHGDPEPLQKVEEWLRKHRNGFVVFLGDYGDRGEYQLEVYWRLANLLSLIPGRILLLRGNHEDSYIASWYGLKKVLGKELVDKLSKAWEQLPILLRLKVGNRRFLLAHGGPPVVYEERWGEDQSEKKWWVVGPKEITSYLTHKDTSSRLTENILWSDPDEGILIVKNSKRGAGVLWGSTVTDKVCEKWDADCIIRAHQYCENYGPNARDFVYRHGGRVITVFSSKSGPYGNIVDRRLILEIDPSGEIEEIWF